MSRTDDTKARERELEYEVDRLRDEKERAEQRERHELQERRRAQIEDYEYRIRTATNWPEALHKQHALFSREAREENDEDDDMDKYFTIGVEALDKALELWNKVTAERYDEVSELDQRIAQINDEIRLEVARRLQAISDKPVYQNFAQSIREGELGTFLDW